MRTFVFFCLGITWTVDTVVRAQQVWEPPDVIRTLDPLPAPTIAREFIPRLSVARTNIVLEETTMKEVHSRLGGMIGHRGDAAESLSWLCFQGTSSSGRWALWLESGEIHGGTVGAFELHHVSAGAQFDARCRVLSRNVVLPVNVQLGGREPQVLTLLGNPTVRRDDVLVYVHEHEELIRGGPVSVSNVLEVVVRTGVVEAIRVWKTTVS